MCLKISDHWGLVVTDFPRFSLPSSLCYQTSYKHSDSFSRVSDEGLFSCAESEIVIDMLFCRAQKLAEEATAIWISVSFLCLSPSVSPLPLYSFLLLPSPPAPSSPSLCFLFFSLSDFLYGPEELFLVIGLRLKTWNTTFWFEWCLNPNIRDCAMNSLPPLYNPAALDILWFLSHLHDLWQHIKLLFTYEKQGRESES